jgi:transcriptional regulator with XRE-family HTH domain
MARARIDPELLQDATRRVLKRHGLTQQGLAERAGVSLGTVGNWARGNGGRPDSVSQLAAAFPEDVRLGDLLVGDDEPGSTVARLEAIESQMDEALALLRRLAGRGDSREFDELVGRVDDAASTPVRDVTRSRTK